MRAEAQPWVDAALFTGGLSPVADDRAVERVERRGRHFLESANAQKELPFVAAR